MSLLPLRARLDPPCSPRGVREEAATLLHEPPPRAPQGRPRIGLGDPQSAGDPRDRASVEGGRAERDPLRPRQAVERRLGGADDPRVARPLRRKERSLERIGVEPLARRLPRDGPEPRAQAPASSPLPVSQPHEDAEGDLRHVEDERLPVEDVPHGRLDRGPEQPDEVTEDPLGILLEEGEEPFPDLLVREPGTGDRPLRIQTPQVGERRIPRTRRAARLGSPREGLVHVSVLPGSASMR